MNEKINLEDLEDGLESLEYLTNPYFREAMYKVIDELRLYRNAEGVEYNG